MTTTDQQEGVLTLNNVRISFPTLFEAKAKQRSMHWIAKETMQLHHRGGQTAVT